MRTLHISAKYCLLALLLQAAGACHLDKIADCDLLAGFRVEQITNDKFTFINESESGPGISYSWNFNDGPLVTESDPEHTFSKPGTYFVTLTAMQGDCIGVFQDTVVVQDSGPVAQFNVSAACFQVNCPISFQNTSINGFSWKWDFGDPDLTTDTDTSRNSSWTYPRGGTFKVRLIAFSQDKTQSDTTERDVVITIPTFARTFTAGTNPGTDVETVVGIDQNAAGGYYLAVCNGKACFFPTADAAGTVSAANAVTAGVFSAITINNFKKFNTGYILAGEASSGAITAGYAFRLNSSFQFQTKNSLHLATENGIDAASDVTLTDAGTYLFCGFALDRPDSNGMYFIHTPSTLIDSWHRYLFHTEPGAWARAIHNYAGGYLVAGYKKNGAGSEACFFSTNDNLVPAINGNMFWGATDFYIDDILPLANGLYALVGNNITSGSGRIRVVNSSGARQWDQAYAGFTIRQALFTAGGRLIAVGETGGRAAWQEIDPASGNTLGNAKTHLPAGLASAGATCAVATSDGGFALGGNGKNGAGATLNFILKLDQNGNQ